LCGEVRGILNAESFLARQHTFQKPIEASTRKIWSENCKHQLDVTNLTTILSVSFPEMASLRSFCHSSRVKNDSSASITHNHRKMRPMKVVILNRGI
jgi:hypothetical protein